MRNILLSDYRELEHSNTDGPKEILTKNDCKFYD